MIGAAVHTLGYGSPRIDDKRTFNRACQSAAEAEPDVVSQTDRHGPMPPRRQRLWGPSNLRHEVFAEVLGRGSLSSSGLIRGAARFAHKLLTMIFFGIISCCAWATPHIGEA
jgi:hypothetical protein